MTMDHPLDAVSSGSWTALFIAVGETIADLDFSDPSLRTTQMFLQRTAEFLQMTFTERPSLSPEERRTASMLLQTLQTQVQATHSRRRDQHEEGP